jgi:hypothetical protein
MKMLKKRKKRNIKKRYLSPLVGIELTILLGEAPATNGKKRRRT